MVTLQLPYCGVDTSVGETLTAQVQDLPGRTAKLLHGQIMKSTYR